MKIKTMWGLGLVTALAAPFCLAAPTAITGANIVNSQGAIEEGVTIIVDQGTIQAIGENIPVTDDMDLIDAEGRWVTSGFVAASGNLGLEEVGAVGDTVDTRTKHAQLTAAFEVADAFNAASTLIPVARTEGITSALIMPSLSNDGDEGGYDRIFAGTAALADMSGGLDSIRVRSAAVVAYLGDRGKDAAGGSRAAAVAGLRAALEAGTLYNESGTVTKRYALPEALEGAPFSVEDVQQFALVESRKLPLLVHADRVADIAQALKIQQQFGIRMVIIGGAEAWKLAAPLAQANIGVILNGENNLPVSFDHLGARLDSAAILSRTGVEIAFSGENATTHNARNMRQVAGLAVAHGLQWEQAIRALSRSAAGLLGFDADVGQLQAGAIADLVVWDGDPLELDSYPSHVFIQGEVMDLSNRQTKLRDRYLDLKSELPPAYR